MGLDSKYGKIFFEEDLVQIIEEAQANPDKTVSQILQEIPEDHPRIPHTEPVFIIRAKSETAPAAVRAYADISAAAGSLPNHIASVRAVAESMEDFQRDHRDLVKIPD